MWFPSVWTTHIMDNSFICFHELFHNLSWMLDDWTEKHQGKLFNVFTGSASWIRYGSCLHRYIHKQTRFHLCYISARLYRVHLELRGGARQLPSENPNVCVCCGRVQSPWWEHQHYCICSSAAPDSLKFSECSLSVQYNFIIIFNVIICYKFVLFVEYSVLFDYGNNVKML